MNGIAERLRGVVEAFFIAHELEHVAKLQPHIRQRGEDEIATAHAGDGDIVKMLQAELADGFAEHAFVRQHHAAVGDIARSLHEVLRAQAADDETELIEVRLRAHGHDRIAEMQSRLRCGGFDLRFIRGAIAGDHHAGFLNAGHLRQQDAIEVWILDAEIHALERLDAFALFFSKLGRFRCHIDFEHHPQQDERADDADDGERVSGRVGQSGQRDEILRGSRRGERLLRRTESRCVRGGTGEKARDGWQGHAEQPATDSRHHRAARDEDEGVAIEHAALLSQRGEEARPHLHAEREDEEHEPEVLQKVRDLCFRPQAEMRRQQTGEEHTRDAQLDAFEAHIPQPDAREHHDA